MSFLFNFEPNPNTGAGSLYLTCSFRPYTIFQAGDLTGIWYGSDRPGIRWTRCDATLFPEAGISKRSGTLNAEKLSMYDVIDFDEELSEADQYEIFSNRGDIV